MIRDEFLFMSKKTADKIFWKKTIVIEQDIGFTQELQDIVLSVIPEITTGFVNCEVLNNTDTRQYAIQSMWWNVLKGIKTGRAIELDRETRIADNYAGYITSGASVDIYFFDISYITPTKTVAPDVAITLGSTLGEFFSEQEYGIDKHISFLTPVVPVSTSRHLDIAMRNKYSTATDNKYFRVGSTQTYTYTSLNAVTVGVGELLNVYSVDVSLENCRNNYKEWST